MCTYKMKLCTPRPYYLPQDTYTMFSERELLFHLYLILRNQRSQRCNINYNYNDRTWYIYRIVKWFLLSTRECVLVRFLWKLDIQE